MKKCILLLSIVMIGIFGVLPVVQAQNFRPIRYRGIVPKNPGGAHDIVSRGMASVTAPGVPVGQPMLVNYKRRSSYRRFLRGQGAHRRLRNCYSVGHSGKPAEQKRRCRFRRHGAGLHSQFQSVPHLCPFRTPPLKEFLDYAKKHPNGIRCPFCGGGWRRWLRNCCNKTRGRSL